MATGLPPRRAATSALSVRRSPRAVLRSLFLAMAPPGRVGGPASVYPVSLAGQETGNNCENSTSRPRPPAGQGVGHGPPGEHGGLAGGGEGLEGAEQWVEAED